MQEAKLTLSESERKLRRAFADGLKISEEKVDETLLYASTPGWDSIAHMAFVYNGVGDGRNVLTRFHKPNIVRDIFTGPRHMQSVLAHFKKNGSGVLVYLRDGAAGVPVSPLPEEKTAEADRNKQWREVGVGAQILRDLGVTSIRNLTSSVHDYKGLSGFGIEIVSSEQLEG